MKTQALIFRYFAVSILIFALNTSGYTQVDLEKAREQKANFEYAKAIASYQHYFLTKTPGINDARDMAKCYMMLSDPKHAEEWMLKVISFPECNAEDILQYANVLKSNGKYDDAITQYNAYALKDPTKKTLVDKLVLSCQKAEEWIADPVYFKVVNAKVFNSKNSDFGIIPFKDGYIYASNRKVNGEETSEHKTDACTGNSYFKLYFYSASSVGYANPDTSLFMRTGLYGAIDNNSVKELAYTGVPEVNGQSSAFGTFVDASKMLKKAPEMINGLNDNYHNAQGVYDATKNILYFTRAKIRWIKLRPINNDPTSWYDYTEGKDYTSFLEIYSAKYINGKWTDITPFEFNKSDKYSVAHPALSHDKKVLYFISDMPGGYGKTDIYYCKLQNNGKWSKPVNAGPVINTAEKETFPFIDKDGTLYFSSDGHMGMGGLDLFSSKGSMSKWTVPENLKYPFNSSKDDFSISFTDPGKSGLIASNREGGEGEDDLYYFSPDPPKSITLVGIVEQRLEDKTIEVLRDATIQLFNLSDNSMKKLTAKDNGMFYSVLDCGSSYKIAASKDGYFTQSKYFDAKCKVRNDTIFVELILDKIIIDKPIVLENIYYDFDKYNIRPDAAIELDKLVQILIDNPDINIELGSHTDCRGTFEYNDVLSDRRAESAVKYIVTKGIDAARMTWKGYGEKILVNDCADEVSCTEEEHQLNRRTEFKVTSINKKK